jgi:ADP-ribose pyrophosphatase YjhB (NUDIX family)
MRFRFCPACAAPGADFARGLAFRCPVCGFEYFHNVASAAGAIIDVAGSVLFVVRAKDPAKGRLALPGGFIDPGERAETAVRRECVEEIGWAPDIFEFLATFPNRYDYKGIVYNTCDLFFVARAAAIDSAGLVLAPDEAAAVRLLALDAIDPEEIAFESTRRALELFRSSLRPSL